jgi:hypothetical protein
MNTQAAQQPWKPEQVRDHFIVTRWHAKGGHDTLTADGARRISRFRSAAAAEFAAARANVLDCFLAAMKVAPEDAQGHFAFYADQLVRHCGMTEAAARAALDKAA